MNIPLDNGISRWKCLYKMSILPTAKLTPIVVIDPQEVVSKQKEITNLYNWTELLDV